MYEYVSDSKALNFLLIDMICINLQKLSHNIDLILYSGQWEKLIDRICRRSNNRSLAL